MQHLRSSLALTLLASVLGSAAAQTPPPIPGDSSALRVRALAATCANCHGTNGAAVLNANVPGLAGMPAPYIVEQMKGFKSGARPATIMHQIAKGYTEAQLTLIAGYFAAQPARE